MFWKIALVFLLTTFHSNAQELAVPKAFVNGEVADANDFNANNNYLVEKIEEEKTRIDQLLANARWNNADESGSIVKRIDCTTNQLALVEAYQANAYEDQLTFLLTGSCFGAYHWLQDVNDEGALVVSGQIQPKNQVVALISDKTTNPSNRAKIVPRKLTSDRDYFAAGILSSFGNGLYLTGLDIEMGVDDSWGILFSRSSNGDATDVSISGNPDSSKAQIGVLIQNGAAAYIGTQTVASSIDGVATGIQMLGESMGNIYGNLTITATNGLKSFNGGTFQLSLSEDGKITGSGSAIDMNQGAQGFINNDTSGVSIEGNISVSGSSLSIGGNTIFKDDALIGLNSSTLNIWNANSGISADRISCSGPSFTGVAGLSMNNNDGNGCLDQAGWKTLIDSVFPSTSASSALKRPDLTSSRKTAEPLPSGAGAAGAARIIKESSPARFDNEISW